MGGIRPSTIGQHTKKKMRWSDAHCALELRRLAVFFILPVRSAPPRRPPNRRVAHLGDRNLGKVTRAGVVSVDPCAWTFLG